MTWVRFYTDSSNTLGCYNKPFSFLLIHHLGPRCSLGGRKRGRRKMKNELLKFRASSHFFLVMYEKKQISCCENGWEQQPEVET